MCRFDADRSHQLERLGAGFGGRFDVFRTSIIQSGIVTFLRDERGQELGEYALLIAFLFIATCAICVSERRGVTAVWGSTNSVLKWAEALLGR